MVPRALWKSMLNVWVLELLLVRIPRSPAAVPAVMFVPDRSTMLDGMFCVNVYAGAPDKNVSPPPLVPPTCQGPPESKIGVVDPTPLGNCQSSLLPATPVTPVVGLQFVAVG